MEVFRTETDPDFSLLDNRTGELLEWRRTRVVSIDDFIMFFFASMPELFKLEGLQMKVLMCCWKASTYNNVESAGNVVYNNKTLKDYIRSCGLNISDTSIDVVLSRLTKMNILIKKCRGMYLLNPEYFFKGRLSDRSQLLLSIQVDPLAADPEHTEEH